MHVFLSYSHADRSLAARLRRGLEAQGLVFNEPSESPGAGTSWRQQVEQAIRSADAILLLLSPSQKVDAPQQLTWRLALQAVWDNPSKRWLPILLKNAKLPPFVRSGAAGKDVRAIRIRDPKDLGPAVQAILQTLGLRAAARWAPCGPLEKEPFVVFRGDDFSSRIPLDERAIQRDLIEIYPSVTDEDRAQWQERLSEMRKYVEQLKH